MIYHQLCLWTQSGQLPGPQGVDAKKSPNLWTVAVTRPAFEQWVAVRQRPRRAGNGEGALGNSSRGAFGAVTPLLSAVLDAVGQLGDLVVDGAALGHQRADLAVGVHDGGVVAAAELSPDLGQ